jgi:hypothetical protein
MQSRCFRLPLLLFLLLHGSGTKAMEQPNKLDGEGGPQRCSEATTTLLQTRLNRAHGSWLSDHPQPSDFEMEAQRLNLVVKAESIKAHALKRYECSLELSMDEALAAEAMEKPVLVLSPEDTQESITP